MISFPVPAEPQAPICLIKKPGARLSVSPPPLGLQTAPEFSEGNAQGPRTVRLPGRFRDGDSKDPRTDMGRHSKPTLACFFMGMNSTKRLSLIQEDPEPRRKEGESYDQACTVFPGREPIVEGTTVPTLHPPGTRRLIGEMPSDSGFHVRHLG